MKVLLMFVPLIVVVVMYATFIKLAARVLRQRQVSWGASFACALLAAVLGVVARMLPLPVTLPWLGVIAGIVVQVLVGGWVLGKLAAGAHGGVLGVGTGTRIIAIASGMLLAVVLVLIGVVHSIHPLAE